MRTKILRLPVSTVSTTDYC